MHSADCLQKEGRKTTSGRFGSVTYGRGVTELSTLFKRKTLFIRIGYDHECPRAQGERSVGLGHIFQWTPRPGLGALDALDGGRIVDEWLCTNRRKWTKTIPGCVIAGAAVNLREGHKFTSIFAFIRSFFFVFVFFVICVREWLNGFKEIL